MIPKFTIGRCYEWLVRYSKRKSRRGLYEFIQGTVRNYGLATKTSVINIGAGGEISEIIRLSGVITRSLDISKQRNPDIVANIECPTPFEDNSIDVVFLFEVLEHTLEPRRALAEIHRILRPGGLLVGSTPFAIGLHDAPNDFFRFTEYGLRDLLAHYDLKALTPRNNSLSSVSGLLSRIFVEGSKFQNEKIVWLSPIIIVLCETLELLSRCLPDRSCTSGFVFIAQKRIVV